MSADLSSNRLNAQNLNKPNNFDDYEIEDFAFDDESISDTSNLGQNAINSSNSANNSNNNADLSGRTAPIDLGSILEVLSTVITNVVPPVLLVAGGVAALTITVPVLGSGFGALFAPLCFGGAIYWTIAAIASIDDLEAHTEILTQRINILDKLNHLYGELEKLQEKEDESGVQPQIAAKQKEIQETQEMLNNFDMHYGTGSPARSESVRNELGQGQGNLPYQNLPPINPIRQSVNRANVMDEDEDFDVDLDDMDDSFDFADPDMWSVDDEDFEMNRVVEVEDDEGEVEINRTQVRPNLQDSMEDSFSDYGSLNEDSDDF